MIFGGTCETASGSDARLSSAAKVVCVVMQKSAAIVTAFLKKRLVSSFMIAPGVKCRASVFDEDFLQRDLRVRIPAVPACGDAIEVARPARGSDASAVLHQAEKL